MQFQSDQVYKLALCNCSTAMQSDLFNMSMQLALCLQQASLTYTPINGDAETVHITDITEQPFNWYQSVARLLLDTLHFPTHLFSSESYCDFGLESLWF